MQAPLLQTQGLSRSLDGEVPVTLVQDITLDIFENEIVVITGPSGSGKSSLLYLLGLLDRPSKGKLLLRGQDTSVLLENEKADLRLAQLGFVFQFHFLLPEFSALENVLIPMKRLERIPQAQMKEQASEVLASLGLAEHMHKLPKQLSGGQSQRVALARALANRPSLILADEPTGNLDTASSATVQDILIGLSRREKSSVIVVTHDAEFAKRADRRIHIVDGKIESITRRE